MPLTCSLVTPWASVKTPEVTAWSARLVPQPHAVHEQVVEKQLREVVELKLDARERRGGGDGGPDDDGRRHHAEAVALDRHLAERHRAAHHREEQQERIGRQE